jgi:uncharacterized YigZ family protein
MDPCVFTGFCYNKLMNQEPYFSIAQAATAEINIERSRFIGHCREVNTEADAKTVINEIRTAHAQATHNCYAYRLGSGPNYWEYYHDHGEPSGTAGKPILGAIQRLKLTNVVVVITRYFGGKKLGVRGLIEAYGQAATTVLEAAGVIQRIPRFTIHLTYQYADHSLILHRLGRIEATVVSSEYTDCINTIFTIPEINRPACVALLAELPVRLLT